MQGEARELIKEGVVTAVFPKSHEVRCEFADKDGLISAQLPVLTPCAFGDRYYNMPDVGDSVVCLFTSNADTTGTGFVIGSRFNDKAPPNANSIDITRTDYKDGSFIEYNREEHTLRIKCIGEIYIDGTKIYLNSGGDEDEDDDDDENTGGDKDN